MPQVIFWGMDGCVHSQNTKWDFILPKRLSSDTFHVLKNGKDIRRKRQS